MTDIKRDFLYEFNQKVREIYSQSPSIVSVFENIDNGSLRLSPIELPDADFVNELSKFVFVVKKILNNPYKSIERQQDVVPVSRASAMDQESIRLTLGDSSLWSEQDGKLVAKRAYTLINVDVFTNYENAFIYQLIKLIVSRLSKIKEKLNVSSDVNDSNETKEFFEKVCEYISKLLKLSNEQAFLDNSDREINSSEIFVTDVLKSDKRYNYCYRFFCKHFKRKNTTNIVNNDFRVLYHNFALIQILYNLNKNGFKIVDANYYIPASGKMFIDTVAFEGESKVVVMRALNGVDISVNDKIVHIEFAKSLKKTNSDIVADFTTKNIAANGKYDEFCCAYLSADANISENIFGIGYKNADLAIKELIKRF